MYDRYTGPFPFAGVGADLGDCPKEFIKDKGSNCERDVLTQTIPEFVSGGRETEPESLYLPDVEGKKFRAPTYLAETDRVRRFAYDADGTIAIFSGGGSRKPGVATGEELRAMNSLDTQSLTAWGPIGGLGSGHGRGPTVTFIFPEKRDIAGISMWIAPGQFVGINKFEQCIGANTRFTQYNHAWEDPDSPGVWHTWSGVGVATPGFETEENPEGYVYQPLNKCGAPMNMLGFSGGGTMGFHIGNARYSAHNFYENQGVNAYYRPSHYMYYDEYPTSSHVNVSGVRAITLPTPYVAGPLSIKSLSNIHIYGYKTAPNMATVYDEDDGYHWFPHSWQEEDDVLDQVDFCLEDGSYRYKDVSFGNVRRNEESTLKEASDHSVETDLYFKNLSATRTAEEVTLSTTDIHVDGYNHNVVLSLDGENWDTIIQVNDLGPGEVIGPVYTKLFAPLDEEVGLQEMRFRLHVEGWTIT